MEAVQSYFVPGTVEVYYEILGFRLNQNIIPLSPVKKFILTYWYLHIYPQNIFKKVFTNEFSMNSFLVNPVKLSK